MKRVSLKPFNNKIFYKNRIFRINNGHNIFFNFDKKMMKKRVHIETSDLLKTGDVFLYCDVPYPWSLMQWFNILLHKERNVLFCFESPIINPFNHFGFLRYLFKKIYSWDDRRVDSKYYFKHHIPQLDQKKEIKKIEFEDRKLLTMVCAKKSSLWFFRLLSSYKRDLYNKRLDIINYFEKINSSEFHLYGWGWNKADSFKLSEKLFGFKKYKVYKGEIEDKLKMISQYKYCFALENAVAPGYITEKIFDCFKAGCVPIYYGAPNISKYVPKSCFIDFRDYPSYEDLLKYLKSIDKNKYKEYIIAGQDFLQRKSTQDTWFEKGFESVFMNCISEM